MRCKSGLVPHQAMQKHRSSHASYFREPHFDHAVAAWCWGVPDLACQARMAMGKGRLVLDLRWHLHLPAGTSNLICQIGTACDFI